MTGTVVAAIVPGWAPWAAFIAGIIYLAAPIWRDR